MISPLIFSSLERIETISTAMELRRFGKNKKRTWYTYQEMTTRDRLIILGVNLHGDLEYRPDLGKQRSLL